MLLFSVIIPTYNRADILSEALDSVKAQTYRPIEIIIVNDGSTDNTEKVVEQWANGNQEDSFLNLQYYYQANSGQSHSRNHGIKKMNGEYVQFLDSDDLIHPRRLEKLVSTFERKNADLIVTGHEEFDHFTKKVKKRVQIDTTAPLLELALEGKLLVHPLICAFKSSLVRRSDPWYDMPRNPDKLFIEKAMCLSDKSIALPEILGSKRTNRNDMISIIPNPESFIHCQGQLALNTSSNEDISLKSKRHHRNTLIRMCCRFNSTKQYDLANQCYSIVANYGIEETPMDKFKLWVCRTGRIGGLGFAFWVLITRIFNSNNRKK
jgi:glycosyltransferase involved in cell wall biosynthesis